MAHKRITKYDAKKMDICKFCIYGGNGICPASNKIYGLPENECIVAGAVLQVLDKQDNK